MAKGRRYEIGVGVLLVVSALVAAFMALRVGSLSGIGGTVDVTVPIEDAAGLKNGTEVAVAGVSVGRVKGLVVDHNVALVTLALDPDAEIRRDSHVRIRSRSVLGERYLEIIPVSESAPLLVDGDALPRVQKQLEIDEIVNALGPVLQSVDPELMGRVLDQLARAITEDPERLDRMIENADVLLANLSVASEELPGMIDEGKDAIAAVESAAGEIEARADEAEGVIAKADDTLDGADEALDAAKAALEPLDEASEDLAAIAKALADLDDRQIERLLLEEGIRIRLFGQKKRLDEKRENEGGD